jgi:RHS repeat-associated protein
VHRGIIPDDAAGPQSIGIHDSCAWHDSGFFQQRQFDYDNRGFLLAERVPEKGAAGNGWVYYSDYDAMGNVGRKSDGDVELVSRWDGAGRLRSVEASSGCASDIPVSAYSYVDATGKLGTAVTFNYFDGIEGTCSGSKMLQGDEIFSDGFEDGTTDAWSGSLSSEDSLSVVHTYVYGGRGGRLSSVVTSVGDDDFTQGYAWDELGNLSQLTYPDLAGYTEPAEALGTVTNTYTLGHLTAVPEFASSIKYHSNGDLKAIWRTNGRYDAFWLDQHSMGRPRRINAAVLDTRAVVWSTGEYQYDGSGNVKQVGSNEFVYDGLHRLVHGEVDDGAVSQDYVYDGLGNLVEITETSGVPETRTISVDHTTNRLSGGTTYDSVGNLTSWGGFNYSWRVTGEMRARTGPGINKWFGYDAGGERVVVEDKTTGVQTYTLRNLDGKVLRVFEKDGATWAWTKDYVYRGGLLLASRDATGTLHFTLDHLGTPRYVLDQNGLNPIEHEYFGFGEEATTTGLNEPMKFTGHERDLEGTPDRLDDLDYMHARYYSPVLARFLSVDPVGGKIGSSQSWNRYSYVLNNPLNLMDPDGRLVEIATGARKPDALRSLLIRTIMKPTGRKDFLQLSRDEGFRATFTEGELTPSSTINKFKNGEAVSAITFGETLFTGKNSATITLDSAAIEVHPLDPSGVKTTSEELLHTTDWQEGKSVMDILLTDRYDPECNCEPADAYSLGVANETADISEEEAAKILDQELERGSEQ